MSGTGSTPGSSRLAFRSQDLDLPAHVVVKTFERNAAGPEASSAQSIDETGCRAAPFVRVEGSITINSALRAFLQRFGPEADPHSVQKTPVSNWFNHVQEHLQIDKEHRLVWRDGAPSVNSPNGEQPLANDLRDVDDIQKIISNLSALLTEGVFLGLKLSVKTLDKPDAIEELLKVYDRSYDPESVHPSAVAHQLFNLGDQIELVELQGSWVLRFCDRFAENGGLTGGALPTQQEFEGEEATAAYCIWQRLKEGVILLDERSELTSSSGEPSVMVTPDFAREVSERFDIIKRSLTDRHIAQIFRGLSDERCSATLAVAVCIQRDPELWRSLAEDPFNAAAAAHIESKFGAEASIPEAAALAEPALFEQLKVDPELCDLTPDQIHILTQRVTLLKQAMREFPLRQPIPSHSEIFATLRNEVAKDLLSLEPMVRRDLLLLLVRATRDLHEAQHALGSHRDDDDLLKIFANLHPDLHDKCKDPIKLSRHPYALAITLSDRDFDRLGYEGSAGVCVSSYLLDDLSGRTILIRESSDKATLAHELEHVLFQALFVPGRSLVYPPELRKRVGQAGTNTDEHRRIANKLEYNLESTISDELAAYTTDSLGGATLLGLGFRRHIERLSSVTAEIDQLEASPEEKQKINELYVGSLHRVATKALVESFIMRTLSCQIAADVSSSLSRHDLVSLIQTIPAEHPQRLTILCSYLGKQLSEVTALWREEARQAGSQLNDMQGISAEIIRQVEITAPYQAMDYGLRLWVLSFDSSTAALGRDMIMQALYPISPEMLREDIPMLIGWLHKWEQESPELTRSCQRVEAQLRELEGIFLCDYRDSIPSAVRFTRLTDPEKSEFRLADVESLVTIVDMYGQNVWKDFWRFSQALYGVADSEASSAFLPVIARLVARCEDPHGFAALTLSVLGNLSNSGSKDPLFSPEHIFELGKAIATTSEEVRTESKFDLLLTGISQNVTADNFLVFSEILVKAPLSVQERKVLAEHVRRISESPDYAGDEQRGARVRAILATLEVSEEKN